jgi:hypothetical protein
VKTIQTYFHTIQLYLYTNTTSFTYVFIAKKASKVVSTLVIVLITLGFFCNVTTTIVLVQCKTKLNTSIKFNQKLEIERRQMKDIDKFLSKSRQL